MSTARETCVSMWKHFCVTGIAICLTSSLWFLPPWPFSASLCCRLELSQNPPFSLLVLQRRKKVPFSVPLEPLVLQKGSINLSPSMQWQPRATNDLLLYFFQCFSACSFRPNWLPVIPVRVQELVGKNRASDCFRLCCCSAVPLDMFDCGSYVRSWCNGRIEATEEND